MCGIVGVISHSKWGIDYADRDIFIQLLTVGILRGNDGTGVIIADDKGAHRTLKIGAPPQTLFEDGKFKNFFTQNVGNYGEGKPKDRMLIGHNRATSVGASNTANAHPHEVGNITLVHNGTLKAYSTLPEIKSATVDSLALCSGIAELGIDEAISRTHGSYAIVYYNAEDNTVNFLRNSERPLAFATDSTRERLYFASEKGMLRWILEREKVHGVVLSELKEDTLLTFHQGNPIPEARELKGPTLQAYWRANDWNNVMEEEYLSPVVEQYYNQSSKMTLLPPAKAPVSALEKAPPKNMPKTVRKAIKKLGQMGHFIELLDDLNGLTRGDPLVFRLIDFVDKDPEKEQFTVMGKSTRFPNTIVKFHLQGAKTLDAFFEAKQIKGYIKHMMHYPTPDQPDEQFVVWIEKPAVFTDTALQVVH